MTSPPPSRGKPRLKLEAVFIKFSLLVGLRHSSLDAHHRLLEFDLNVPRGCRGDPHSEQIRGGWALAVGFADITLGLLEVLDQVGRQRRTADLDGRSCF